MSTNQTIIRPIIDLDWDDEAILYPITSACNAKDDRNELLRVADLRPGSTVVELGSGPGELAAQILRDERSINLVCMDLSSEFVRQAWDALVAATGMSDSRAKRIVHTGDFTNQLVLINLRDRLFPGRADVIICHWCLHLFSADVQVELLRLWSNRLLKPDGKIIFTTTPNPTVIFGCQVFAYSDRYEFVEEREMWANAHDRSRVQTFTDGITTRVTAQFGVSSHLFPDHQTAMRPDSTGNITLRTGLFYADTSTAITDRSEQEWPRISQLHLGTRDEVRDALVAATGMTRSAARRIVNSGDFSDQAVITNFRNRLFPSGTDVIICHWCLHMFSADDQVQLLRLWSDRLLKRDGKIVFTTSPNIPKIFGCHIFRVSDLHEYVNKRGMWANAYDRSVVQRFADNIIIQMRAQFDGSSLLYPDHETTLQANDDGVYEARTDLFYADASERVDNAVEQEWRAIRGPARPRRVDMRERVKSKILADLQADLDNDSPGYNNITYKTLDAVVVLKRRG